MGKGKKKSHKPTSEDTNQEKLYLLHMDLCGPVRVESVNGKKYILVIVDNYSRFTWVKCVRSNDEAPDFIIKFLKMIQVQLKAPVCRIRIDNGTEFVNKTLHEYYEQVDISHKTSVARSPEKNGVVERRNRTLIKAACTIPSTTTTITTSGDKLGRTVTLTTEDMQKKKNDQYRNFRAEGSKMLEQTFTRLQVIIGQLQFMGVEVEQDDLNQKFLTTLDPEWLMHTIVWRNRSDLDTMSLDDLYNHLTVYEAEENAELPKTNREDGETPTDRDHALIAEAPTEFALMTDTSTENKKDLSWTGLLECADDTVTDYSRPSPVVESSLEEDQNRNPSASENVASPITPKQFVKFVKASDSQSETKTDEKETPKKTPVKITKQYRKPNVKGNQRNWNNLKSHQLGPDFVMKKKACFNCGDFNHLAY
nr:putative ribonuclease H-like domain-containing protein [Tanacetum cinerariifolium]